MRWFWESLSGIAGKELGAVIAAAIVALGGIGLKWLFNLIRWLVDYHRRLDRVRRDVGREFNGERSREGRRLSLSEPIKPPKVRLMPGRSPKVLVVANAKGGVGKTTVAANVAARLAELASAYGEKPVLLVDLDFQGTLSAMAIYGDNAWLPENGRNSDSAYFISGNSSSESVASIQKRATFIGLNQNQPDAQARTQNSLRLMTSYYDLAQAEKFA